MSSPYFRGPKPGGKAASLTANERNKTPKTQTLDKAPRPIDKAPRPINKQPAPMNVPDYPGHSGDLGPVGHLLHNLTHPSHAPEAVRTRNKQGKVQPRQRDVSVGEQAASVIGVNPVTALHVLEHPVRFIQHQQHLTPQQKANSAIGAHLLGSLLGAPAAGRIEGSVARKGQTLAMSGGGESEEPKGASELRGALAGKIPPKMGEYEKVGAKIDGPNLGKSASHLQDEQAVINSQERARRIAGYESALKKNLAAGLEPDQAHKLASKELSGVFPRLEFTAGKELNRDNISSLFQAVEDHPALQGYDRLRAKNALLRVFDGNLIQPAERKLLAKVFGESDATKLAKSAGMWRQFKGLAGQVINLPRAFESTLDMSALFRQNLVASITHPMITARNIKPMLKAFSSEGSYKALEQGIVSHPLYDEALRVGLPITDFEHGLAKTEEAWYGANLGEKITDPVTLARMGSRKVRGKPLDGLEIGNTSPVRMSGRAYVGLLNKTRLDIYTSLREDLVRSGLPVNDKNLGQLAKAIGSATGRGSGPEFMREYLPALNSLFFSPRLLFSRLDYLNPVNYIRLNPVARKEYMKGALGLLATVGTILSLAKMAGARVGVDPRNADFAKIRLGNTRIDLLGGFQQPIRLLAELAPSWLGGGKVISSTSGKTLTLGPEGPGKLSRFDIGLRFLQGKLAPVPGMVVDASKGTNFIGQPFSWRQEAYQHFSPLAIQDAIDLGRTSGPAAGAAGYGLSAFGFGIQTYGSKQPKPSKQDSNPYFGGSGSSPTSPYFQGDSGSSGSSPYFSGG